MPKRIAWKAIVLEHPCGTLSGIIKGPVSLQSLTFNISEKQKLAIVSAFPFWQIVKCKIKLLLGKD